MLLETGSIDHVSSSRTYVLGKLAALALADTWVGMSHSDELQTLVCSWNMSVQFWLSLGPLLQDELIIHYSTEFDPNFD